MIPEEVRDVLTALLKRSQEGQVNWLPADEVMPPSRDAEEDYVVVTPHSSVNIWLPKGSREINGEILNSRGLSVASFCSESEDLSSWGAADKDEEQDRQLRARVQEEDRELLSQLLASARRKALNVEGTLHELKREVLESSIVGAPNPPNPEKLNKRAPF
jgi:hypothetical protein